MTGASVIERIKLAMSIVGGVGTKEERLKKLAHISEAVPCAFGIVALNKNDAMQAVFDAVNIGYGTDTIAAIVGTMAGAFADMQEERFAKLYRAVQKANNIDIIKLKKESFTTDNVFHLSD